MNQESKLCAKAKVVKMADQNGSFCQNDMVPSWQSVFLG
jgi:hypothetical protein